MHDCRADPTRVAPLVQALIAAEDPETGKRLSDEEICDELIMFFFAGHDTTATTLTYALWSLGRHADCQDRVAAEVAALPDRPLTPDDIPQLGYTVQVIRESLRLCPPAPTGTRMACRDVEVGGYLVPKGTMLIVGRMAVQRDPHYGKILLIRSRAVQPGELQDSRSVAIPAVRRRSALVHW